MKINNIDFDYGDLIFSERYELDQKAYSDYFADHFLNTPVLTYNNFYGTEIHKKYLLPYLRKMKLEKIKKYV